MVKGIKKAILGSVVLGVVVSSGMTVAKANSWSNFTFPFTYVGEQRDTDWFHKYNNDCITMQCTYMDVPSATYIAQPVDNYGETVPAKEFYEGKWDYFYNDMQGRNVKMHGELTNDEYWDGSYASGYWYVDSGIAQ